MLAEYLTRCARQPFAWGSADCALFAADWVALHTSVDPAAAWRGRYASETEAAALFGLLGLTGLIAQGARSAGLLRTRTPQPGDIGVAVIGCPVGAIRTPSGWAARVARGIVVTRAPRLLAAWEVPCRKP